MAIDVADAGIKLSSFDAYATSRQMTYVVWVYFDSFSGDSNNLFQVAQATEIVPGDVANILGASLYSSTLIFSAHHHFTLREDDPEDEYRGGSWTASTGGLSTGKWYCFAITYDGNSKTNDPVIYKDGIALSVTTSYRAKRATKQTWTPPFTLRSFLLNPEQTGIRGYDMHIAHVAWWDRILSATEIARIAIVGPFAELNDQQFYWPFDHVNASDTPDLSGNDRRPSWVGTPVASAQAPRILTERPDLMRTSVAPSGTLTPSPCILLASLGTPAGVVGGVDYVMPSALALRCRLGTPVVDRAIADTAWTRDTSDPGTTWERH